MVKINCLIKMVQNLFMLGNKNIFRMALQITHSQRSLSTHIEVTGTHFLNFFSISPKFLVKINLQLQAFDVDQVDLKAN